MVTLLCSVRNCRMPLAVDRRAATCSRGHGFDRSRSGYLNLLQPQDRRSRAPGDSREAVLARRRFLDRGFGSGLGARIVKTIAERSPGAVLEIGCGEGHHIGMVRGLLVCETHGIDISVPAIDLAARRHHDSMFVVGNADRFLPYADASFDAVASITARIHPEEFHRVLRPGGTAVIALPSPLDLIELRTAVLGSGDQRDRTARTIEQLRPRFALLSNDRIEESAHLDRAAIDEVMTSSYRALRHRERERLHTIKELDVTLGRDILVFRRADGEPELR